MWRGIEQAEVKKILIKVLHFSVCYSFPTYWRTDKEDTLHSMTRHATNLLNYKKALTVQTDQREKTVEIG